MICASLILAAASMITGIVAAIYWYLGSTYSAHPFFGGIEPGDAALSQQLQQAATAMTVGVSSRRNKIAALWTAVSVGLAGLSAFANAAVTCLR